MAPNIIQHRARIGSFYNVISKTQTYKSKSTMNSNTKPLQIYKLVYFKYFIMVSIAMSVFAAVNNSDMYLYRTKVSSQTYLSGQVSTDIASYFLLPYTINVLAASSSSMISNFQSRYLHGNRKNQGIKICHWNKGGSFLKNKMPEINNIVNGGLR